MEDFYLYLGPWLAGGGLPQWIASISLAGIVYSLHKIKPLLINLIEELQENTKAIKSKNARYSYGPFPSTHEEDRHISLKRH